MIPIPKLDIRTIIIIVLAIVLFFSLDGCSRIVKLFDSEEVVGTKTTTTIKYEVKDKSYRDIQPMPDYFKPIKVQIVYRDRIVTEVPPGYVPGDGEILQEVNKYSDSVTLPNGTIKYNLLTEGRLLSTDFTLNTKDSIITKEIETIRTAVKSGLFGVGGTTIGLDGRIKDVQAGVSYVYKNRWYIESGLQYDIDPKITLQPQDRAGVLLKFGLKL